MGTNVNIKADDFSAIKEFALANHIGMVVVGPEDPLVKGVYDYFKNDVCPGRYSRDRPFERGSATGRQQGLCEGLHDAPQHSDSRYKSISAGNLEGRIRFPGRIAGSLRIEGRWSGCR